MRKLLLVLFLTSPCFANGPKYVGAKTEVQTYQEFGNVYHDIANPVINIGTASTMTITQLNVSSITVRGTLTATSGTINSFMVAGTATNDNSPAGRIGEYSESVISVAANLTRGSFVNFTSISLTPGDWDVTLNLMLIRNGATWTDAEWGISTTSADSAMGVSCRGDYIPLNYGASDINVISVVIPSCRISLSANGTVYAPVIVNGGAGTPQGRGRLSARRVR